MIFSPLFFRDIGEINADYFQRRVIDIQRFGIAFDLDWRGAEQKRRMKTKSQLGGLLMVNLREFVLQATLWKQFL